MRVNEIKDDRIRTEAEQFIQNMGALATKLNQDWSRENIRNAAAWFKVVADEFSILADHPDPFPGE